MYQYNIKLPGQPAQVVISKHSIPILRSISESVVSAGAVGAEIAETLLLIAGDGVHLELVGSKPELRGALRFPRAVVRLPGFYYRCGLNSVLWRILMPNTTLFRGFGLWSECGPLAGLSLWREHFWIESDSVIYETVDQPKYWFGEETNE